MASHEEPEDIQVEVEREEPAREQPPARASCTRTPAPSASRTTARTSCAPCCGSARVCGHHFPVGAEERVEQLADPGSFRQIAEGLRSADPLAFTDLRPYTERLSEAEVATGLGDALIAGTATIEGMPCVLCTMDFAFMGGSMGSVVGEVFTRASDVAAERGIPLVSVAASGGARMQENVLALMQMAKTVCAVDLLRESGVPYVSVLAHPTTGGVIASFAALGDFVVAEPDALLSFAGPRVVQETTRESLPDDFGRAESSLEHGLIDAVIKRPDLKDEPRPHPQAVRRWHARADGGRRRAPRRRRASSRACCGSCARARTATRTERRAGMNSRLPTPFRGLRRRLAVRAAESDIWDAVQLARDDGRPYTLDYADHLVDEWIELHGDRAGTDDHAIVAGIGSFRGRTIAIVGHQKGRDLKERAFRNFGMAQPQGYAKARRIFALADRLGFPVVTMIDTPGAYPGVEAEQAGQAAAIAQSMLEMVRLRVPRWRA